MSDVGKVWADRASHNPTVTSDTFAYPAFTLAIFTLLFHSKMKETEIEALDMGIPLCKKSISMKILQLF